MEGTSRNGHDLLIIQTYLLPRWHSSWCLWNKSWHKLLTYEPCGPYHAHITWWLVNQCQTLISEDFLVTWKSLQLGSRLLFWKAAPDLREPLQADQQQEQDIVMDQFVFHFGTFEHSFYGPWLHQDSLTGDEISSSYYCSQLIVLRHDIWMTFSSQVTELSINFFTDCHWMSCFLNCQEMLTLPVPKLNWLWQREDWSSDTGGGHTDSVTTGGGGWWSQGVNMHFLKSSKLQ